MYAREHSIVPVLVVLMITTCSMREDKMMPQLPLVMKDSWFNAEPEIVSNLKGKVVLIDFWDYTCVNCIRTLPYISEWHKRYASKGLIIIGVHAPEFEFAKARENVAQAIHDHELKYPIVMDNDFTVWHLFGNRYWPAKYIYDKNGILRYRRDGEGSYQETERVIQKLLHEIDSDTELPEPMKPLRDTDVPGAICYRVTPEMYLGYEQGHIGNQEGQGKTGIGEFQDPKNYREDTYYLSGRWWVGPDNVRLISKDNESGSIIVNYLAAEANLVIRADKEKSFKVYIEQDRKPLTDEDKGDDITIESDGRTYVLIEEPRMYALVKNQGVGRHTLRLTTTSNSFAAYAFTFVSSCKLSP